jgi:hypothetical protein
VQVPSPTTKNSELPAPSKLKKNEGEDPITIGTKHITSGKYELQPPTRTRGVVAAECCCRRGTTLGTIVHSRFIGGSLLQLQALDTPVECPLNQHY